MNVLEDVTEEAKAAMAGKLKLIHYAVWGLIVILVITSLIISYISLRRSTLDNDSIRSLQELTVRMDRAVTQMETLNKENRAFVDSKSTESINRNNQDNFNYESMSKKYGNTNITTPDDLSSKWLFSEDGSIGGNKPLGDK